MPIADIRTAVSLVMMFLMMKPGGGTNSLNIHRNPYAMSSDCALCHKNGDKRNPYLCISSGTHDNPGLGCMGCHGRQEDAGNDSISQGLGAGLRQHHWNTGAMVCGNCHSDANPANCTPVGEDVKPAYYGTADTAAADPCNPIPQDEINENWDLLDLVGLDNDGDGLYDGNDPDCGGCTDNDNDGFSPDGGTCGLIDCNDNDPNVNPDEIDDNCDGLDNDCDGQIDEDFTDPGN